MDLFTRLFPEPPRRSHKIFLVHVLSGLLDSTPTALAGPLIGAPQAALVIEKLIALGVRSIIAVGWCGSLQSHVSIGDVVIPTGAFSEEGTSKHYPSRAEDPGPSPDLVQILKETHHQELPRIHEGRIWSTDAPYRETRGKIRAYQDRVLVFAQGEGAAAARSAGADLVADDDEI